MRCKVEAIALILWPALMSAARGYHDAGTVFGDMIVAALMIVCVRCVASCLRNDKARHAMIELKHDELEFRDAQNDADSSCS